MVIVSAAVLAAALWATADLERDVAALKKDQVPDNAWHAIDRLRRAGPEVIPLLEGALDSPDHTQRHLAASLLRHREDCPVSSRLIRVSVEALRHDDLPASLRDDEYHAAFWAINAGDSVEWLGTHASAASAEIRVALASTDQQQAFLAAVLCGHARLPGTIDGAARILIAHLSDNSIRGDGVLAAVALQRMGREVLPLLNAVRDAGDTQHKAFVLQIIRELEHPEDREGNTASARTLSNGPGSLGIGESSLANTPLSGDALRWNPVRAKPTSPQPEQPPAPRRQGT
jgi:hypothetical protein